MAHPQPALRCEQVFANEPICICENCGRRYAYNYRRGHSKRQCIVPPHVSGQKRFTFAGSHHRSWKSLRLELDKCVLLCLNCHAEEHDLAEETRYQEAA